MTTEVAHRPNAELALVPVGRALSNLEEVVTLAKGLAVSGLVPDALRGKPNDVAVILLYGAELGLTPMQAIQGIYVVKGRPMLSAQTWGTKIRQNGHRLVILSSTRTEATVCITRGDDKTQHVESFTIEDAVAAGLCEIVNGKVVSRSQFKNEVKPWEAYTKTMLRNRAITHCARYACPEAAFGNAGIWGEEHGELEDETDLRPFIADDEPVDGEIVDAHDAAQELAELADELAVNQTNPGWTDAEEVPSPLADERPVDPWGTTTGEPERKTCEVCGMRLVPERAGHDEAAARRGFADHEPVWLDN
jgi:hypothetical protein